MNSIFIELPLLDMVKEVLGEVVSTNAEGIFEGKKINGVVFQDVSNEQLWKLDQLFLMPAHVRSVIKVQVQNLQIDSFYYSVSSVIKTPPTFYDTGTFLHLSKGNYMGQYDIHLLVPCSLDNFNEEYINTSKSELGDVFLKSLSERNASEFKGDFVKNLDRYFLGYYLIYPNFNGIKYPQMSMITLSKHEKTNVGVLNISIISGAFPGHHILTDFCERSLCIENENQSLCMWLNKLGISIYGTPRSVVFAYNELSDEAILNALVSEAIPAGAITGEGFTKKLQENLAQYNTAKVYASEVCLIEIIPLSDRDIDVTLRISDQTIELFFIELLLLQDAAISRISAKILSHLDDEIKKKSTKYDDILDELVCESAQAILFFDLNEFLFPTVRLSAENISKCFGIDRQMMTYEKYKNILDQLIAIRNERQEEVKSSSLNSILLILTLVQVFPLLINGYKQLLYANLTLSDVIIYLLSLISCFSLWIIYRINIKIRSRLKRIRKEKNKHYKLGDVNK